jgi:glycosyltransferase
MQSSIKKIKVSVITVSYNSSKTIFNTIDSVNNQTYNNIEHIFIDGLSSDDTVEKIKQTSKRNNLIISEKDKGLYDAINKGISNAGGDVIGILHSDDFFNSHDIILDLVTKIQKENLDAIYGDLQYVNKTNTNKTVRYWKSCEFTPRLIKKGWMPAHPTLFLKKEVFKTHCLYDLKFTVSSDYDFMLRVLKDDTIKFGYLPRVITNMRIGGASNKNLQNIVIKMIEDYRAIRKNKIGSVFTLILKNTSKIKQFFRLKTF